MIAKSSFIAQRLMTIARVFLALGTVIGTMQSQPMQVAEVLPPSTSSPTALIYSIVSIKHNPHTDDHFRTITRPDGLSLTHVSLALLLRQAFGDEFVSERVFGLPDWTKADRFDIEARIDPNDVATLQASTGTPAEQLARWEKHIPSPRMLMLQELLARYFNLLVHHDKRLFPSFELTFDKLGPNIHQSSASDASATGMKDESGRTGNGMLRTLPFDLTGQGVTINYLAEVLSSYVGRVVVDKTALSGQYDFHLKWEPDILTPFPSTSAADPQSVQGVPPTPQLSIYTAIREQLGLRLRPSKSFVDCLVIDRLALPKDN